MKIVPYVKSNATSSNVYDTQSSSSKPFAKFNIRTLSDDESDYGPKSRSVTNPPSYNHNSNQRNSKRFSDSSDEDFKGHMSSRSATVRRNTKTLNESDLRATSKSAGKFDINN